MHAQAARSGRTLRLHAQALRLCVSWRRHFGGQQGSSLQIDGCRRCGSDTSTQRCGVTRFGPPRSNRVRQVPRDVPSMRLICRSYDSRLWRRSDRCLAASSRCAARPPRWGSPSEADRGTAATPTGTYDVSCVASVACTVPASVLSAVHWPVWIMIRDLTFRANLSQRGRDLNQE